MQITISIDKKIKKEFETYFKSKGIDFNSGLIHTITDFLMRSQTRILNNKMDEYKLSPREREVVKHICAGLQVKEIANKLFISLDTVRKHMRSIYLKCDVHNKVELLIRLTGIIF